MQVDFFIKGKNVAILYIKSKSTLESKYIYIQPYIYVNKTDIQNTYVHTHIYMLIYMFIHMRIILLISYHNVYYCT